VKIKATFGAAYSFKGLNCQSLVRKFTLQRKKSLYALILIFDEVEKVSLKNHSGKNKQLFRVLIVGAMLLIGFGALLPSSVRAGSSEIKGIDVSHWQGDINWNSVASAGYKFAFCKATQGVGYTDPKFTTNMNNGKSAGLLIGAYHFATPFTNGVNDACDEADYFIQVAGNYLKSGWLRPVLDLEQKPSDVSWSTLSTWADTWMTRVKSKTSVEPILYVNSYYANNLDSSLTKYHLWIAHYGVSSPNTGKWSSWDFWQYSSEGSVPGISGNVDLDVFNGDLNRLNSFVIVGADTLTFVNHPSTTFKVLDVDVGLDSRAARNIIAHRDGPDGVYGTADDNPFDTIQELDDVPYVGSSALSALKAYAATWTPPSEQPTTKDKLLEFVNHRTTTTKVLDIDVGLDSRAARNIVAHRDGPDGVYGTADDNPFDSRQEVDDVPYVGSTAMSKLDAYAANWTPPTTTG